MSPEVIQAFVGTALIDREFCQELLRGKRTTLLAKLDLTNLTDEECEAVLAIEADSIQEFATGLYERLIAPGSETEKEVGSGYSDGELPNVEVFLVECLAWGLLQTNGIEKPPVPVREMIQNSHLVFERLTLLEMNLGLYKAAYRQCLDGSRLIVVELTIPPNVQRGSMARELYVAFCYSSRAVELHWFCRKQPYVYGDLFARCLLMPASWVRQACAEAISTEGLAARFGVPTQMMTQRLNEVVPPYSRSDLGESLAQIMFSLEEPWRGRFLDVVANMTADQTQAKQRPTQKEIAAWLGTDPSLYQDTRYLLGAWRRSWNVWPTTSLAQGSPA